MKKRILFVDDETSILMALELALRRERRRWEMVFVHSAALALARLGEEPFDLVVSDMRMPVMSGGQLLAQIMEQFPNVIRLMLTGEAAKSALEEADAAIQELILKPCQSSQLRSTIERWLEPAAL